MSPFLFLLDAEALNLLVAQAKRDKRIKGIKVSRKICITHLLFVDDVLIFGWGSLNEWSKLNEILNLFCSAIGMMINPKKSTFLKSNISTKVELYVSQIIPFTF